MNYLIIGNIASGKTLLSKELSKKTKSEIFAIDDMRKVYSDGTFAGEFLAWARMLEVVQHPQPDIVNIYEFSGTGKNAWFVREAIKYSQEKHSAEWMAIYCLCDKKELMKRCEAKVYDVPLPYNFGNPASSIPYMSEELQKKYGTGYWNCREFTVRTDQLTPEEGADSILKLNLKD